MRADGLDEATMAQHMGMAATCAIMKGKMAALKALVEEEGFDVNVSRTFDPDNNLVSQFARPLLHYASETGGLEAVVYLIEWGADPLARNDVGWLAHHTAAARGHLAVLRWLLDHCRALHVDTPASEPSLGLTALHAAAMRGHLDIVHWLIGAGADPLRPVKIFSSADQRASQVAEMKGCAAIVVYLREQEAIAEEAAARRARSDKRRQKQKKAKARRQQEQQQAGEVVLGSEGIEAEEEVGAEEAGELLARALATWFMPSTDAAAAGGEGTEGATAEGEQDDQGRRRPRRRRRRRRPSRRGTRQQQPQHHQQ
jgi:hypothetical protein